jgi:hypothetical protein
MNVTRFRLSVHTLHEFTERLAYPAFQRLVRWQRPIRDLMAIGSRIGNHNPGEQAAADDPAQLREVEFRRLRSADARYRLATASWRGSRVGIAARGHHSPRLGECLC